MLKRRRVYQFVTGIQIAFSSLSLVTICLTLPVMYNNIQTTIDYAENEMRFCEVCLFVWRKGVSNGTHCQRSNREALVEVEFGRALLARHPNRTRRSQNYGGYAARGTNPSYDGNEQQSGAQNFDQVCVDSDFKDNQEDCRMADTEMMRVSFQVTAPEVQLKANVLVVVSQVQSGSMTRGELLL